jgi:tetratricopeptide (TPR) repeat protein
MTALARWLQHGMEQGPRFWLLLGGAVLALVVVAVVSSGVVAGRSANSQAWVELTEAKSPEDRIKIADAYPKAPVADWARIEAAYEEYNNGLVDLTTPGKKESAGPRLKKALELFQAVAKDAPKDSSQALGAAFGIARTLEARNELPEAIEQYRELANKFPNTPEAKQALAMAKALEDPENVQFYKELYAYKPPANPSPGLGSSGILDLPPTIPGLSPGIGKASGSTNNSFLQNLAPPPGLDAPPPSTNPIPAPSTTTPAVEPPKSETPASKPADAPKPAAPKSELPSDPFGSPK